MATSLWGSYLYKGIDSHAHLKPGRQFLLYFFTFSNLVIHAFTEGIVKERIFFFERILKEFERIYYFATNYNGFMAADRLISWKLL